MKRRTLTTMDFLCSRGDDRRVSPRIMISRGEFGAPHYINCFKAVNDGEKWCFFLEVDIRNLLHKEKMVELDVIKARLSVLVQKGKAFGVLREHEESEVFEIPFTSIVKGKSFCESAVSVAIWITLELDMDNVEIGRALRMFKIDQESQVMDKQSGKWILYEAYLLANHPFYKRCDTAPALVPNS